MLQRGSMPTLSSRAAELSDSWSDPLQGDWRTALREAARLPETGREFALYGLAILTIAGALSIHLILAVQILDARLTIRQFDAQITRVEQANNEIIYVTSLTTSVDDMMQRGQAEGYAFTTERRYVQPQAANASQEPLTITEPAVEIAIQPPLPAAAQTPNAQWRERLPTLSERAVMQARATEATTRWRTATEARLRHWQASMGARFTALRERLRR